MAWVTKHSAETYAPPEPPREYTRAEKRQNWWHYHWAWVLLAAAGLVAAVTILHDTVFRPRPDIRVACVTRAALPDELLTALESELAALAEDANGDGKVLVQVVPYTLDLDRDDALSAQSDLAARASLVADIGSAAFTTVLLDDPEDFQQQFEALAPLGDGRYALPWQDCPVPAAFALGRCFVYSDAGEEILVDGSALVQELYLARRVPPEGGTPAAEEALWQALTAGAV